MSQQNNALVGGAFDKMRETLGMYLMRELIRVYGDEWWPQGVLAHLYEDQRRDVSSSGDDIERIDSMDVLLMLRLVTQAWKDVFRNVMDRRAKSWAFELIDTRNAWAHATGEGISDSDAQRALDTMARFMDKIDPETASEIRRIYKSAVYGEGVKADASAVADAGAGRAADTTGPGLVPWRAVVPPQSDVAEGKFKTAELALDLAEVAKGNASFEYQDPYEFYARTYITEGMRSLIATALHRVSVTDDDDGDPVVELKTAFGGGKTHSMLAIWHLMRMSSHARQLPGIAKIMDEENVPSLPEHVYVCALVGTDLDPTSPRSPNFLKGKVNTLWGELAYRLCQQKGDPDPYAIIRTSDSKGVSPGAERLGQFFDAIAEGEDGGPCVILMDEFVAYARKMYGKDGAKLPAGTFGNVLSFLQELTEAVKRTENCMLIASLPESERELGDEGGEKALKAVEHVFGRVNSIWKSATNEEGFEIVKRRLFGGYDAERAEPVVEAFMDYYRADPDKFPVECHDDGYRERMLECYPVHPQVFDRLYQDWSTLPNFQRTRGALRFMALVIHQLWKTGDQDPLIMPGSIDFSDRKISEEILQYLDPSWNAVIDADVDGEHSMPATIDRNSSRFKAPRAAQRMARSIFLGSAPSGSGESLRGLDASEARLGAAIPSTNITVYDDALNKMRDELSYLYSTGDRYWYETHPTLEKLARDRASKAAPDDVDAEIVSILQKAERLRSSGFPNVYVCPRDASEVPDAAACSLVLCPPRKTQGHDEDSGKAFSADVLSSRGSGLRTNRNMLLFVAADTADLAEARQAVKRELAWRSIVGESDALELTRFQKSESDRKLDAAEARAKRGVLGAYRHMLVPSQEVGDLQSTEWEDVPIPGDAAVSKRAFDKAESDEYLVTSYSPFLLDHDLGSLLFGDADHLTVPEIWGSYCRYGYMRRLADQGVLRASIEEGVASKDYFAYADGYDGERYLGLKLGERAVVDVHSGLVVKRERALEQLAFDNKTDDDDSDAGGGSDGGDAVSSSEGERDDGGESSPVDVPAEPKAHEVEIEAALDKLTAGSEVGTIVEEILQRLYDLPGASAELALNAYVEVPDGIDESTLRIIRENARTLGITLRAK